MFERHLAAWPDGVPRSLTLPETSVYENLASSARRHPDKAAIVYYGTTISYGELNREVERLAGYLHCVAGVAQGARVLLYMQNSPQFVIGYYAILRANAVVVPVNPMNRSAELAHYAADTGAAVVLCGQELLAHARTLLGQVGVRHIVVARYGDYVRQPTDLTLPDAVAAPALPVDGPGIESWGAALEAGHKPPAHVAGPGDLAVMPFTSGTTGSPKGCMHTHGSVMATLVGAVVWNPASGDSVMLTTLPLFHVTGMQNSMNGPLYAGATIVVMTRWDRHTAAELIQRHGVTHWRNITTMAVDFLSAPELADYDLSSLKAMGGGGAAMPAAIERALHERTGLHYIEGYGLSETIAATHINPPRRPKAQCLGIPVFDVDARIVDPDSGKELGPNEIGEILVHGPQVFQGYWNRPLETGEAFVEVDGKRFFRTGDMGYFDEEGYFFLVDRIKRMINASGFKVWPSEVESLMYAHPDIKEVCVIASPDPRRGETVKAVIVPTAEGGERLSADDVQRWCRDHMAAYKVPRHVEFVEELPRSATGKLLWRVLEERERESAARADCV